MADMLSSLVPILGRALLHFVWQGALIGLLAAIALQWLRNARPQARYAVACAAMLACVLAPLIGVLVQLAGTAQAPTTTVFLQAPRVAGISALRIVDVDAWTTRIDEVFPLIVALWAAGASLLSLRMTMGMVWIRRLHATPQGTAHVVWQMRLDDLAQRFGLRRPVALRLVDKLDSPASAGWRHPVVLLPVALLARMPVDLIEALLAHELAHVRRHDYFVNLLQCLVEALLFYHPVTWWLSRRIRIEREHIADQLAADITGAPRRLALALSELSDCQAHCPAPPHLAQAAKATHGGHLMSRIQQLVQPSSRVVNGKIAFPLVGLAAACIALYAHAQSVKPQSVATAPSAAAARGPLLSPSALLAQVTRIQNDDAREAFALVRKGQKQFSMSGSSDDIDAIRAARDHIDSDFLWFRRADKRYVIVDPATVARATDAWRKVDELEPQMRALSDKMEVHSAKIEGLSTQMETLASRHQPTPAMDAASRRMEQLGEQQQQLGSRQARLAAEMLRADDAERDALETQMNSLSTQMDALSEQMDQQSEVLDAEAGRLDANRKPMDALAREMDEATKPMDALATQMDALGKQQDKNVQQAERELQKVINSALQQGLAKPAPGAVSKQ